jgi:hypothetical protein
MQFYQATVDSSRGRDLQCSSDPRSGLRAAFHCGYARSLLDSSVVTPKPANGGQGKTGQREEAGDSVVLPCSLLWRQVHFRTPTPRTTFEYMTMMEKTIEHGGNGSAISQ